MERARETGLFRYSLVQELTEPGLSLAERGWRAREMAGRVHEGPGGRRVTVSYSTLTRWRRLYESGGFDSLVPSPRQPAPRTPEEVLAVAEALKREKPGRTAAQVRRILQQTAGWAPSDRTLQRLFDRLLELGRPAPGPEEEQRALGRFECTRPNEMWTGDTPSAPRLGSRPLPAPTRRACRRSPGCPRCSGRSPIPQDPAPGHPPAAPRLCTAADAPSRGPVGGRRRRLDRHPGRREHAERAGQLDRHLHPRATCDVQAMCHSSTLRRGRQPATPRPLALALMAGSFHAVQWPKGPGEPSLGP